MNSGEVLLISLNSLFGLNLGEIMWDQKYKVGMLDLRKYCSVVSLVCQLQGDWPLNFTESFLGVTSLQECIGSEIWISGLVITDYFNSTNSLICHYAAVAIKCGLGQYINCNLVNFTGGD